MRRWYTLCMLLWAALAYFTVIEPAVEAAAFTIDLTAAQQATIQWKYTAVGGAATGFSTVQLWFAEQVKREIAEWDGQKALADKSAFCVAFNAANTTVKNQVCSGLSLANGCTPCQQ